MTRYRYYEDLYNNQYRWGTEKNGNGKFEARILKSKTRNGWGNYKLVKSREFNKRKTAKSYCLKAYLKAVSRQKEVLSARETRKQTRLDSLPKFTKDEISIQNASKQIKQLEANIARADTKIKGANTRRKTYEKKIKYFERFIQRKEDGKPLNKVYPKV